MEEKEMQTGAEEKDSVEPIAAQAPEQQAPTEPERAEPPEQPEAPTEQSAGTADAPSDAAEDNGFSAWAGEEDAKDGLTEAAESDATQSEQDCPKPDWSYGADAASDAVKGKNRRGIGGFLAVFGGVIGVCVLVLFLTLWLGDRGFEIIRNVYYDRTVYVREDGTVVGQYTPGEVAASVGESTVTVSVKTATSSGFGSGFVYRADGYIITNYHVIESGGEVQVILSTGEVYDATVVGYNAPADVAVLKVDADVELKPVKLGNSDAVLVGETVVAIGTPAELSYAGTATFGKISAATRLVTFGDGNGTVTKKMRVIQTDTSVNPGNSGGPLANLDGEVIGIVVMKLSTQGSDVYEGLGFALPINGAVEIADQIIAKGSFTGTNPIAEGRSVLGITGHPVTEGYWYRANSNGSIDISATEQEGFVQMPATGVHAVSVTTDSDAFGRVQYGDIIVKVNGLNVISTVELIEAVNRYQAGETVTLTVFRNGELLDIDVRLAEEPLS